MRRKGTSVKKGGDDASGHEVSLVTAVTEKATQTWQFPTPRHDFDSFPLLAWPKEDRACILSPPKCELRAKVGRSPTFFGLVHQKHLIHEVNNKPTIYGGIPLHSAVFNGHDGVENASQTGRGPPRHAGCPQPNTSPARVPNSPTGQVLEAGPGLSVLGDVNDWTWLTRVVRSGLD